jgi:hypothetical protein
MSVAAIATSTSGRMNERRCTENHHYPFCQSFRQAVPGLPPEQPSEDGAEDLAGVSGLWAKQGRAEESVAQACA